MKILIKLLQSSSYGLLSPLLSLFSANMVPYKNDAPFAFYHHAKYLKLLIIGFRENVKEQQILTRYPT